MKSNKQNKAVLFDLDGTILNSLGNWMVVIEDEIEKLRIIKNGIYKSKLPTSKGDILKNLGPQLMNIEKYGLSHDEALSFVNNVVSNASVNVSKSRLHFGATKAIKDLFSLEVRLGVVSNSKSEDIARRLKDKKLTKYFTSIVGRDKVKNLKPDPESLLLAIKELQVDPKNTYMVGDSPADILAANMIGIHSVLYYPKSHWKYYEYKTTEITQFDVKTKIISLDELVGLISK